MLIIEALLKMDGRGEKATNLIDNKVAKVTVGELDFVIDFMD